MKKVHSNLCKYFQVFLFFLLILSMPGIFAQTLVKAEIDSAEYAVGDVIRVQVKIEGNPGLHGLYFDLSYDESILVMESIRDGSWLRRLNDVSNLLYADNSTIDGFSDSKVAVSFAMKGSGTEDNVDGTVVELSFRIVGSSVESHTFAFSNVGITDKYNQALSGVSWQNSDSFSILQGAQSNEFVLIRKPYNHEVFYGNQALVSLIASEGDYLVRLTNDAAGFDSGYISVLDGRLLDYAVNLVDESNLITAELFSPDPQGGSDHIFLSRHSVRAYKSNEDKYVKIISPSDHALLNTDMVDVTVLSPLSNVEINGLSAQFHGEMQGDDKVYHGRVWLIEGFNKINAVGELGDPNNILHESSTSTWLGEDWLTDDTADWTPNTFVGALLEVNGQFAEITGNTSTVINFINSEIGLTGADLAYKVRTTRETEDQIGVTYIDSIDVYYQKDSSIFNIVRPLTNQSFKPSSSFAQLDILGEIDSLYKTSNDPATGGPVENEVDLEVTYIPRNPLLSSRTLLDEPAVLEESPFDYENPGSNYVFRSESPIYLENLEDGEIIITAYKNRFENTWDDKVSRLVYVDGQRLWIDLVQPNVFTSDLLDSRASIENFNEGQPIENGAGNINLSVDGYFSLSNNDSLAEIEPLENVVDMAEAPDGTLYALVNPSSSQIKLYEKEITGDWTEVISQTGLYGFDLSYSDIGLLIGASNVPANGNSGLYLFNGTELINFSFEDQALPHIQFVESKESRIYLYGSFFNFLFSFSVYDLEEDQGVYKVNQLDSALLSNSSALIDFVLSDDAETTLLLSDDLTNNVAIYVKQDSTYHKKLVANDLGISDLSGITLVSGQYENSDYSVYVVLQNDNTMEVLMENSSTGRFFRTNVNAQDLLSEPDPVHILGVEFSNSSFTLLYETAGTYKSQRGQIFFDQFFPVYPEEHITYTYGSTIEKGFEQAFISTRGPIYMGLKSDISYSGADSHLYKLLGDYAVSDSFSTNYVNDDIDGMTGFSFDVDPLWFSTLGVINFGFSVREIAGSIAADTDSEQIVFSSWDLKELSDLINQGEEGHETPGYTITRSFYLNGSEPTERIHVEFTELQSGYLHLEFELNKIGNSTPELGNIEVFKKIPVQMTKPANGTLVLPIQGYVYDTTAEEIVIQHVRVPLGRDGSFYYVYTLDDAPSTVPIHLYVTNGAYETASLNFTVEIVDVQQDLWDLQWDDGAGYVPMEPDGNNSFSFFTEERTISISGKYYGLVGSLVGYELYELPYTDGDIPVQRGIFTPEDPVLDLQAFSGVDLGSGYEGSNFLDQPIELLPNDHRLVIYVESSGGIRKEYVSDLAGYPIFNYSMAPADHEIQFDAEKTISETKDGYAIVGESGLFAYENETAPYAFTAEDVIRGEIFAIEQLDEVLVTSLTPGLVFENGLDQTIIDVDSGNRFSVPVLITMGSEIREDFYFVVRPTNPLYLQSSYIHMKRGMKLSVSKNFENTAFVPDFSALDPSVWSEEQLSFEEPVPLRFSFINRDDIPLPTTSEEVVATFVVNYAETITGVVHQLDANYFTLLDENGTVLSLTGIKPETNRIQWTFEYRELGAGGNSYVMSSSLNEGMEDELFYLPVAAEPGSTEISFSPDLTDIYYDANGISLPDLTISKDVSTEVEVLLNGLPLARDNGSSSVNSMAISGPDVMVLSTEGRNELQVRYTDLFGESITEEFSFLYDSADPVVTLAGHRMDANFQYLTEITTNVTEGNFNRAYLHYGTDIINLEPEVTMLGENKYLLTWTGLESQLINPSTDSVFVEAIDMAGKTDPSDAIPSYGTIERPDEVAIREVPIQLPIWDLDLVNDADRIPANETSYTARPFAEHTKFAPQELLERVSVKEEVEDQDNVLIKNLQEQKLSANDGDANDYFGGAVSISGNYAIVGAPYDDDKGNKSGSAYIFERESDGTWIEKQKLLASDGTTNDWFGSFVSISGEYAIVGCYYSGAAYVFEREFGGTWIEKQKLLPSDEAAGFFGKFVSISGEYAIVSAHGDDDNGGGSGSAYIFERQANGIWAEKQKLLASDGAAGDFFGISVSISGSYAIVGAHGDADNGTFSGSAYIFERESDGTWIEKQKLLASDGSDSDYFGELISISGTYAVVSAQRNDDKGFDSGSAYVFERQADGTWLEKEKLLASDGAANDVFGSSVSISGEYTLVGAIGDDDNAEESGSVYVFKRQADGTWIEHEKLLASDGDRFDQFSRSVAISGSHAVIGSSLDYDNDIQSGSVFFRRIPSELRDDIVFETAAKSYLFFQIPKSYALGIQTKDDIQDLVKFSVTGRIQDPSTLEITTVEPGTGKYITLDTGEYKFVEGLNDLYYMVDIDALKTKFTTLANTLDFGTDIKVDLGSLYIEYFEDFSSGILREDFNPADIYVIGESTYHSLSDILVYDEAYEGNPTENGNSTVITELQHPLFIDNDSTSDRTEVIDSTATEFSQSFWLRIEDEEANDPDVIFNPKRIVTLKDSSGTEVYNLSYEKTDSGVFLNLYETTSGSTIIPENYQSIGPLELGLNAWNMITLRIRPDSSQMDVIVQRDDGTVIGSDVDFTVVDVTLQSILNEGASFYFGADTDSGELTNTGFFSIANPFYINRLLTDEELTRLASLADQSTGGERYYDFSDGTSDFGDTQFDLHIYDPSNSGAYRTTLENSDYQGISTEGSFVASSQHKNLLALFDDGNGNQYIRLSDSDAPILHNASITGGIGVWTLEPQVSGEAVYFLGDKNTNYGLGTDRWYSISGEVISMDSTINAWIDLEINGEMQSWKLVPGPFHFIFENSHEIVPSVVKLSVRTDGPITFSQNMALNEGNFVLPGAKELGNEIPEGIYSSAAASVFPFDVSGSIDFWYKPMISNNQGFVNYDVVLLDSELVTIGASVPSLGEDAEIYTIIKSDSAGNTWNSLNTDIKLQSGWHHFQLAYQQADNSDNSVIYFYVDGKLAAKQEGIALPIFGSLTGEVPSDDAGNFVDNLWLGSNSERTVFAEGYLDEVRFSKYYASSLYSSNRPITIDFDDSALEIQRDLESTLESDVSDTSYIIESMDGSYRASGTAFPIDLSSLPAGRYQIWSNQKIKGHWYEEILTVNLENKPRFNLTQRTPLIFAGETKDIDFVFEYDRSYLYETEVLKYAGLAVRIVNGSGINETLYLVQDFIAQDSSAWLLSSDGTNWQTVTKDNYGRLPLSFADINSAAELNVDYGYFYFLNTFPGTASVSQFADGNAEDKTIPLANLSDPEIKSEAFEIASNTYKDFEYMVQIAIEGQASVHNDIFDQIEIEYEVVDSQDESVSSSGKVHVSYDELEDQYLSKLFYDDILPDYGTYDATFRLIYNNINYATKYSVLQWEKRTATEAVTVQVLEIDEFSLLHLDKTEDNADFYLQFHQEGMGEMEAEILIKQGVTETNRQTISVNNLQGQYYIQNISVPKGEFTARITVSAPAQGFIRTASLSLSNNVEAPEVIVSNWVDSLISHNDVYFSWKGTYQGNYLEDIEYSYNFDGAGWTTPNKDWRSVRFYNLEEGSHNFQVKALYSGVESSIQSVSFFVDVHRPVFNADKITLEELRTNDGVLYAVDVIGDEGAIEDASLRYLIHEEEEVQFSENGSFELQAVPLDKDGINSITITAIDRVGNYTDYTVYVDNPVTEVIYPDVQKAVQYSPMTLVGRIQQGIKAGLTIYVKDPFTSEGSDYSSWHRATINPDRTFFVEDLFINPGSRSQEIVSSLTIATVFDSGEVFTRELNLFANEILMPIELSLDIHAVEGENVDTEVQISAQANVEGIANWSIDFNGDGIYDDIQNTANPLDSSAQLMSWTHVYSSLGLVEPRVRVITTDGIYFSVSDSLIIHEKIKQASHKLIDQPISFSSVKMPDNSQRIFVLKGQSGDERIEVFPVWANSDNQIPDSSNNDDIILSAFDSVDNPMANPVLVRALDESHVLLATDSGESGILYEFVKSELGNYEIQSKLELSGLVRDISFDQYKVYISYANRNYFTAISRNEEILDLSSMEDMVPLVENTQAIGLNASIAKDKMGLLVADYYNQRIIRLTNALTMAQQFGTIGLGEEQFLTPSHITVLENRIFVFDETRKDLQIFDLDYNTVTTLSYQDSPEYHNYLEADFFNDIADVDIMARVENNVLRYYALLLSRSTGKFAILELPQWDELRIRIRNNKIVFVQSGEVFTAKPDGADLTKVISSDGLPQIEGALDYPALSPDGKSLIFTSKLNLYLGKVNTLENEGSQYLYDHIYIYDSEERILDRLFLDQLEGYEIERPVFNSNGDTIIFSAREAGMLWSIYTYDLSTGLITQLMEANHNLRFPYYSPDDRFVVFTTDSDGDQDIQIVDVENIDMRIALTNNDAKDSYPVWSTVYPYEISNLDYNIESKIAFVSEGDLDNDGSEPHEDFHSGVYYTYLSRQSDSDLRVVTEHGVDIGSDPDAAAMEVTAAGTEGAYPSFTGDARKLVFESSDGITQNLQQFDYEAAEGSQLSDMTLPEYSFRPAGMKNMITNFQAEEQGGDEIILTWDRYTQNQEDYYVQFKQDTESAVFAEKIVTSQTGTALRGLEMGAAYIVRVVLFENGEEVAISQWKRVQLPTVVARPSYEIDEINPYFVNLYAWVPEEMTENQQVDWTFSWIIDNVEYSAGNSPDFGHHFPVSGRKTILLKATDGDGSSGQTSISEPFHIDIVSDIEPVIEHVLSEDASSIYLTAENSLGQNINFSSTTWHITGDGGNQLTLFGKSVTANLTGFSRRLTVNLSVQRTNLEAQAITETLERTKIIDLDLTELKPIITSSVHETNKRLIKFSGQDSLGNIDWYRASWTIFANNEIMYQTQGVSTFEFLFPERNDEVTYSVSLTTPRKNDGQTETISQFVYVDSTPIEPVIDYEIIAMTEGENVIGQKIVFNATKSRGSDIDFSQTRWSVAVANTYGEQAVQIGPTATYNLVGAEEDLAVEVVLTLTRSGGVDPTVSTQWIALDSDLIETGEILVNQTIEDPADGVSGKVIILDVLESTGPNIDWESTEWLIAGQYSLHGPVVRYELAASGEDQKVPFAVTLYRYGGQPEVYSGEVEIDKTAFIPLISFDTVSSSRPELFTLDVRSTIGANIDWERTTWYIYDGNSAVTTAQGPVITHAFALDSEQMSYPVMVEMFLQGDNYPFIGYKSIDVVGNPLLPIMTYEFSEDESNVVSFSAESSTGSSIDWERSKWTFLDTAETQYGPVVTHEFPVNSESRTYTVSLTLYRRQSNGETESETIRQEITIGSDEIKPVVRAQVFGDYLVLSAEQSQGRGLLLDRAVWAFPGEGDSSSSSESWQEGTQYTHKFNAGASAYVQGGYSAGSQYIGPWIKVGGEAHLGYDFDVYSVSGDLTNNSDTFSQSNYHTGPIARRYIENESRITVTLFVYRSTSDGGVEGESITVNIDLNKARSSASGQGVIYE